MHTQPYAPPSLPDLALLYVALAYGTDADLDDAELALISERLYAWQDRGTAETAVGAAKYALEAYTGAEDADAEVTQAIARMQARCDADTLRAIHDDLVAIALADNRFLHEESAFIERLARAWDIRPAEEARALWSVLDDEADGADWTPIHDLALLYLALAHRPDAHLARTELDAIGRKLQGWLPRARNEDVRGMLHTALKAYAEDEAGTRIDQAVASVRRAVPRHQHAALLSDLHYVARADGVMLVEEKTLILRIARALGLENPG